MGAIMRDHIQQTYKESEVEALHRMLHDPWVTFEVLDAGNILTVQAAPGNGSLYSMILVRVNEHMAARMGLNPEGYLLAMEPANIWKAGTMSVRNPCESHPSYIMEKLGMNLSDAVAMSLILDRVGKEIGS